MFCTNCGKEIIDTAKFCNFCGMPVKNMAASVPVQPPVQSVRPVEYAAKETAPAAEEIIIGETTEAEENVGGQSESSETVENAETAEDIAVSETETAADSGVPTPNDIPTYGGSILAYPAPPAYPTAPVNAVPVQSVSASAPQNKPERKYTFGHIMFCLTAVAIMAIVAGVFAGLYFSVV